jgi:hypothetical protein
VQFHATFALTGSLVETSWVLVRYFTVLTNLLVAVIMGGIALGRPRFSSPLIIGGATLAIVLVGAVYMALLRGMVELSSGALFADVLLHQVMPVLTVIFWLLFAPKTGLRWRDPMLWSVYPLIYLTYAVIRGGIERRYPYPFIDVSRIGWPQAIANSAAIAVLFLIAGLGLVFLGRLLAGRPTPRLGRGRRNLGQSSCNSRNRL